MKAFNNDLNLKIELQERMRKHIENDELVRTLGWHSGRGCNVGCLVHEYDHKKFESIGMPAWFAHIVDNAFELVQQGKHQKFAIDWLEAMPVGFDKWQDLKINLIIWGLSTVEKLHLIVKDTIDILQSNPSDESKMKAIVLQARALYDDKNSTLSVIGAAVLEAFYALGFVEIPIYADWKFTDLDAHCANATWMAAHAARISGFETVKPFEQSLKPLFIDENAYKVYDDVISKLIVYLKQQKTQS